MLIQGQRTKTYLSMDIVQKLTKHEQSVLIGILRGQTNLEIGRTMNIQEKSVKWHVTKVFKSFDVKSRAQLCVEMAKNGMIVV